MQQGRAKRGVRGAEVDREVEGAGQAATGRDDSRAVVVTVEADVVAGKRDGGVGGVEDVILVLGAIWGLGVEDDGLDDVCTEDVVGSGGADVVICAIFCGGVYCFLSSA